MRISWFVFLKMPQWAMSVVALELASVAAVYVIVRAFHVLA